MYCGRTDADVTILTCPSLTENTQYHFRVYAENRYGRSEPLETEYPLIPKRIFGKHHFVALLCRTLFPLCFPICLSVIWLQPCSFLCFMFVFASVIYVIPRNVCRISTHPEDLWLYSCSLWEECVGIDCRWRNPLSCKIKKQLCVSKYALEVKIRQDHAVLVKHVEVASLNGIPNSCLLGSPTCLCIADHVD